MKAFPISYVLLASAVLSSAACSKKEEPAPAPEVKAASAVESGTVTQAVAKPSGPAPKSRLLGGVPVASSSVQATTGTPLSSSPWCRRVALRLPQPVIERAAAAASVATFSSCVTRACCFVTDCSCATTLFIC